MTISVTFKREWVAALRSGKFKQGLGYLQKGDKFCCLGVACRIAGVTMPRKLDDRSTFSFAPLNKAIGLNPEVSRRLGNMNDSGTPFSDIADYIEKHLGPSTALSKAKAETNERERET